MDFSIQNTMWVLIGTALIFFMQAGFAMLEAGFTRAKNSGNIVMKNLMDFACGSLVYLIVGYGLMYGVSSGGFIGKIDLFATGHYATGDIPGWAHLIFNTMFCATAATIVSGAMAERTKFKAYLIYSIVISAVIYPISASWVWGGGWLSELSIGSAKGYIDLAGSSLVHMVGGICGLIGAKFLGARAEKYDKNGNPRGIPGHNITLGALGIFILWFGWFGFNGASIYDISTVEGLTDAANIFLVTNTSAASSAIVSMLFTWFRYGKPDISMTLNGALAGLVSITAGARVMEPWAACISGALTGIIVVVAIEFVEKVLKVDDPVGAIGVHGFCGLFGAVLPGIFSKENGLIITGEWNQLAIQCIGVLFIALWTAVTGTILFYCLKKTVGLRVSGKAELSGLDIAEHGLQSSYSDFFLPGTVAELMDEDKSGTAKVDITNITPDMAIPVHIEPDMKAKMNQATLTKVVIITRQTKFGALKEAMNEIGVTGMTVMQVLGCGMQKGSLECYRGTEIDTMQILPKIQVEMVISKVPVEKVIKAAKKVLYTGHIGDGKIFVYDVKNAIKVRTGEEGYYALQGVDE